MSFRIFDDGTLVRYTERDLRDERRQKESKTEFGMGIRLPKTNRTTLVKDRIQPPSSTMKCPTLSTTRERA